MKCVLATLITIGLLQWVSSGFIELKTDEDYENYERNAISYHFSMLNDEQRNEAFHDALREVIKGDSRVLDIGSGTTLLSMMASKLGAQFVTAVEKNSVMSEIAHSILDLNGFSDSEIRLFTGQSYDLEVGSYELPEPANVYVTETLDSWVIGEGILVALHDAKNRGLITEDAVIIPSRATLYCQLVETIYSLAPLPGIVEGFNLEPMRHMRKMEDNFVVELTNKIVRKNLSDVITLFDYDFQNLDLETGLFNYSLLNIPIVQSGNFHAVAFWFDCALDAAGKIRLDNRPLGGTHWMQMLTFMPIDVAVKEGENFKLQVSHTGEKYIIGSAQEQQRLVRVISSCSTDIELFIAPFDADEEEFIAVMTGMETDFGRQQNVYHGNIGDTFKVYVPDNENYIEHLNNYGKYLVHQEFTIPEDNNGEIVLHEFTVNCEESPVYHYKHDSSL